MDVAAFENLALIPTLLAKIEALENRLMPPITTRDDVARLFKKSRRTINRWIENGYLKEDVHFNRKSDKIVVFIEDAVLDFYEQTNQGRTLK